MNLAPIAAQSECPIDTSYILIRTSRFAIDDLKRPDVGQESGENSIFLFGLRNLLRGGSVFLFCGVSFGLFLRRLLVRGFWRFVTHDPHVMIRDQRSQYGQLIQD